VANTDTLSSNKVTQQQKFCRWHSVEELHVWCCHLWDLYYKLILFIIEIYCVYHPFMKVYSESKQMTITNAHFMTISGHFSTNCIFIFHKNEVQTVILRCLMGLSLDWFKSYGLRCRWRPHACLANFQKIATDKWPFYYHIWPFFCQLYVYISQNWDSDDHFEVLNESKT
jgi:hypothetical protein